MPKLIYNRPVLVEFQPSLRRVGRKLESGTENGYAVHAGTFLRERRMVLESELLRSRSELRRILVHELFHFAWLRFGNPLRANWTKLLENEFEAHARGELGWSAELLKQNLRSANLPPSPDYCCESFCDTAAWHYAEVPWHEEFTLARRWCRQRAAFFQGSFSLGVRV